MDLLRLDFPGVHGAGGVGKFIADPTRILEQFGLKRGKPSERLV
jgi:hypothetical protein